MLSLFIFAQRKLRDYKRQCEECRFMVYYKNEEESIKIQNSKKMNQNSKLNIFKVIFTLLFVCSSMMTVHAQTLTGDKFGKGLRMMAADSSFAVKFSVRMQNRFEGYYVEDGNPSYKEQIYLRRARFKFDGFVLTPKLKYKIEYDAVNAEMLDAVVKWNFAGNWNLWAGQTKLPGNRERVISSQKLQFVDRSLLNSKFTIDRDKGIQLRHHFNVGDVLVRNIGSIAAGEGKNFKKEDHDMDIIGDRQGRSYTYRLEVLPFGKFTSKGDYVGGDLKRESDPKLALGLSFDYNDNAIKSNGQKGDIMYNSRDLQTVFADMMFKCHGFSWMFEYVNRSVASDSAMLYELDGDGEYVLDEGARIERGSFYTGTSINNSFGYLFKNNWEVAARYTEVRPEGITGNPELTEYTLGVSKYVVGHNLKVQSDFSLREENGKDDKFIFRLQLEVAL